MRGISIAWISAFAGLALSSAALAEVKPKDTVVEGLCGDALNNSQDQKALAVSQVCYAKVVGKNVRHRVISSRPLPYMVIKMNDKSAPRLYRIVHGSATVRKRTGTSQQKIELVHSGTVDKGMAQFINETTSERGTAFEVRDGRGDIIEVLSGTLPGGIYFQASQFRVIFNTEQAN